MSGKVKKSATLKKAYVVLYRICGRSGSSYIGIMFEVFIILVLLAAMISIFPLFMQKYSLDIAANEIADHIGLSGCTGEYPVDGTCKEEIVQTILEEYGVSVDDFSLEIDNAAVSQTMSDERGTLVQLGGRFRVTLTIVRNIGIGGVVPDIPVTLVSTATGRSEFYWKTLAA